MSALIEDDPRRAMGVTVEPDVTGPYYVHPSRTASLDVGILAHTNDGRKVVIGEIWAAGVGKGAENIRLDAFIIAKRIVGLLNAEALCVGPLIVALEEIATPTDQRPDKCPVCGESIEHVCESPCAGAIARRALKEAQ